MSHEPHADVEASNVGCMYTSRPKFIEDKISKTVWCTDHYQATCASATNKVAEAAPQLAYNLQPKELSARSALARDR